MAKNHIELRRKRYFKLSSQIAQLDNVQLHSLFDNSEWKELIAGWGMNHTIVLGQSKIFVKRVPVTNIEYDNLFSTKNLMQDFFADMWENNQKDTKLHHAKLRLLLKETGFLSENADEDV